MEGFCLTYRIVIFTIRKVNSAEFYGLTLPMPFDYNSPIVFLAIKKVDFIQRCAREEAILSYTIRSRIK